MKKFIGFLLVSLCCTALSFAQENFITTWSVSAGETIIFPLDVPNSATLNIDWGDTTSNAVTQATDGVGGTKAGVTHTYTTGGTYTVTVSASTSFGNGTTSQGNQTQRFTVNFASEATSKDKILTVQQWGYNQFRDFSGAFKDCINLSIQATDKPLLEIGTNSINMSNAFNGCSNLNASAPGAFTGWDTSRANVIQSIFESAGTNGPWAPDLSGWDLRNVQFNRISALFRNASTFNGNVSGWLFRTSGSVYNFPNFFQGAAAFTGTGIETWDVDMVSDMTNMFQGATAFNGDVSGWTTTSLTDLTSTFQDASSFNQNINGWNITNVTTLNNTFNGASLFNQDLNSWNTSNITTMNSTFGNATAFNGNITGWDTGNVTSMSSTFINAKAFNQNIGGWNVSAVTNMSNMFQNAIAFDQDLGTWDVSNVTTFNSMFRGATAFTGQGIPNWEPTAALNMGRMFNGTNSFDQDLSTSGSKWDVSGVTIMDFMFAQNNGFTGKGLETWDTGNVGSMSSMFFNTQLFNGAIGSWDVSKVANTSSMFQNTFSFNQDIKDWNLESLTNGTDMFRNAYVFTITNYDLLLDAWGTNATDGTPWKNNVTLGVDGLIYCNGDAGRSLLITTRGWTLTNDFERCESPGGVSASLALWFKADEGAKNKANGADAVNTNLVSPWEDKALNLTNGAYQGNDAKAPNFSDDAAETINFNPVLSFQRGMVSGSEDLLDINSGENKMNAAGTELSYDFRVVSLPKDATGMTAENTVEQTYLNGGANTATNTKTSNFWGINYGTSEFIDAWSVGTTTIQDQLKFTVPDLSTPFIAGSNFNAQASESNAGRTLTYNNKVMATSADTTRTSHTNNIRELGGLFFGSNAAQRRYFNGNIAEIILYKRNLNASVQQKLDSYLALKYGITLNQETPTDYIASDDSVFWDANLNTAYNNDIFGVGRDDASKLHQRISKSVNSGTIITLSVDTDFEASNSVHANLDSDISYMVLGNNGGSNDLQSTELPTGTGTFITSRIAREWQVQKLNFAQSFHFKFEGHDFSNANYYLVKDTDGDGDFSNATLVGPLNTDGSISLSSTDLDSGNLFTVVTDLPAPGGVLSDLTLWLRADHNTTVNGSDELVEWDDNNNGHQLVQSGPESLPLFESNSGMFNFNPSLNFDGANRRLLDSSVPDLIGENGSRNFSILFVAIPDSNNSNTLWGHTNSSGANYYSRNGNSGINPGAVAHSGSLVSGKPNLLGSISLENPTLQRWGISNGFITGSASATGSNFTNSGPSESLSIGVLGSGSTLYYNGKLAELMIYDLEKDLSTELPKMMSYLALKYGITLDQTVPQDYLASDGSTKMWDAAAAGTYSKDIFGIGRDDTSELHQHISQSVNDGALIVLSTDSDFTAANSTHTDVGTLGTDDLLFMTLSNNGGPITEQSTDLDASQYYSRMGREWLVQKTANFLQNINLKFTGYDNEWVLLSDDDGDFTTGFTEIGRLSATGEITGISLDNGAYLTLAKTVTGIEFAAATANDDEATGGNLPNLLINGTLVADTDVDVVIGSGTATPGTDFTFGGATAAGTVTVTIPAGTYTPGSPVALSSLNLSGGGSVAFAITDDTIVEDDETIDMTLASADTALLVQDTNADTNMVSNHIYTINNDDALTVQFQSASFSQDEDNTPLQVVLSLSGAEIQATKTIDLDITGGTAAGSGTDYTFTDPTTVTIPVGDYTSSGTVSVAIALIDDEIAEADETILLALINPDTDVTIGTQSATTATILDDDQAVTVSVAVTTTPKEDGIDGTFTLTLTKVLTQDLTIPFTIDGGSTANNPADYTLSRTGSVDISAGDTEVTISIRVEADLILEEDESVIITLGTPSPASALPSGVTVTAPAPGNTATANIVDNDGTVNVNITAPTQAAEDNTDGQFRVYINKILQVDLLVNLTPSGTATGGTDMDAMPSSVTIPAGAQEAFVDVTVHADNLAEGDETVVYTLGAFTPQGTVPAGATFNNGTNTMATVTITDDDNNVVLNITENGDATEGGANSSFDVTLNHELTEDLVVTLTPGGTAMAADINGTMPTSITIPAGTTTVNIPVQPVDDTLAEGPESVSYTISATAPSGLPSGVTFSVGTNNASLDIIDNDAAVTATIVATTQAAEDATNGLFTITLDKPVATDVTIPLMRTGNATNGTDMATMATNVTFTAGNTSATVPVTVQADDLAEGDETVTLTLGTATGQPAGVTVSSGSNATVTITDDDATVLVSIAATQQASEPSSNGEFTFSIDHELTVDLSIAFSTGGSATPGAANDYELELVNPVTIPAGSTSITNTVTIHDDPDLEGPETVILTLGALTHTALPSGVSLSVDGSANTATVTIGDDEGLQYHFDSATYTSVDENTNVSGNIVVQGAIIGTPETVDIVLTNGTATAGSDYDGTTITLPIPANDYTTPQQISFTIILSGYDDLLGEGDETINLALANFSSATSSAGSPATAVVTITDDDVDPAFAGTLIEVTDAAGDTDGDTGAVRVTLLAANGNPVPNVAVTFAVASGSATLATASGTTDANGQYSTTVSDLVAETASFTVQYDSDDNGSPDTAITNGSPADVVFAPGAIAVSANGTLLSVADGAAIADGTDTETITVQLRDANGNDIPQAGINVTFALASGTATLSAPSATTDANGTASITVNSTTSGTTTYTATADGNAVTNGSPATVTFAPGAPDYSATGTQLSVVDGIAVADGTDTETITVQLKDVNGNDIPQAGITVDFTLASGTATLSATSATTDANGTATITVSSTLAGPVTLTAVADSNNVVNGSPASITFEPGPISGDANGTQIGVDDGMALADGAETETITVQLKDKDGNDIPTSGIAVDFILASGTATLSATSATTDTNGTATITVSSTTAGTATITATADGIAITNGSPATVVFSAGALAYGPNATELSTDDGTAVADGTETETLTVQLKDQFGNDVAQAGIAVTFALSSGEAWLSEASAVTDANGTASITVTSGTEGTVSISATADGNPLSNGSPATIVFTVCTLNCDTDGNGECDLNCDTTGDGECDTNCDEDGDGECDTNCDEDGDGECDYNCDEDGDGECDTNCDEDGDGECDTNCDEDGDGQCDYNCDEDGDGECDTNCDEDGDGQCDTNCDEDGDGECDYNCDEDGDGQCDTNCDEDGDGECDTNCDEDGDGQCDLNCDEDGDGECDLNCDEDGDGQCDTNCDEDGDGECDTNCEGGCTENCDTDGDGECDFNCDTDGDGNCDFNCDEDGDGQCDRNCDPDGDGVCDSNCDDDIFIENDLVDPLLNNNTFIIGNISMFPDNVVEIFNRWGGKVYSVKGYDNQNRAFHGASEGSATLNKNSQLPAGVYFYVIQFKVDGKSRTKSGYLYINR